MAIDLMSKGSKGSKPGASSKMISPVTAKGNTPQSRVMVPKRKMKGKR